MGDQFVGFSPRLPDGYVLPDGYELDAICGEDITTGRQMTVFHWTQRLRGRSMRFGPNERDKRKAIRQAWRDYRSGGTDPTAVEPD